VKNFAWHKKDGGPPTTLVIGSAPGESGVSVLRVRFRGGAHFEVIARQHLVCFVSPVRIECRMAGRTLRHDAPAGSLAIFPTGIDAVADAKQSVEAFAARRLPGGYPNLLPGGDPAGAAESYGGNVERLIRAKRHYDPDKFFCSATPLPVSRHTLAAE
jgi:hypothetical protein